MPRNSSGTMTLPAGNPVVSGSTISTTWANSTLGDISSELSDSASRSGKGGFTAPVRTAPGTVAAPSFSYTSDTGTGTYLAAAGDLRMAVGGVDALKLIAGGINGPLIFPSGTTAIQVTLANGYLQLQGNLTATNATFAEVVINSTVARTAGNLLDVQNNAVDKLYVDYQGLLRLASQAAAIQPASMVTAITPNAGVTAQGCAFWKDPCGKVHLEGAVLNASGGNVTNIASTTPLPAGFRPPTSAANLPAISTIGPVQVSVSTAGVITTAPALANGNQLFLDGLSFRAGQ